MADIYVSTSGNDSTGNGSSGNPYASPGKAASVVASGDNVYVKSGTYSIGSSTANVSGGRVSLSVLCRWVGYAVTVGDNGTPPVFQATVSMSGNVVFGLIANGVHAENLTVDGNSQATTDGFTVDGSAGAVALRLYAHHCRTGHLGAGGSPDLILCRAESNTSNGFSVGNGRHLACWSKSNGGAGFKATAQRCLFCISAGNTGAGFRENTSGSGQVSYWNCIAYGNGAEGFGMGNSASTTNVAVNCIAVNNSGVGFTDYAAATTNSSLFYCATYNNTSSAKDATLTRTEGMVTLTGDPFVAAASDNFALDIGGTNDAAAQQCKAAGIPGAFPGSTTTGYLDIGAAQHQDTGGSGAGGVSRARQVNAA